jgi:hypothetical protein
MNCDDFLQALKTVLADLIQISQSQEMLESRAS